MRMALGSRCKNSVSEKNPLSLSRELVGEGSRAEGGEENTRKNRRRIVSRSRGEMSKQERLLKSSKTGTGHILQDLLSSTVRLHRSNFVPSTRSRHDHIFPLKTEETNDPSPELRSCSICAESRNLRPLVAQEMEILGKFVLNQEQISFILQTEDHPAIFCCKICSSAILSLAKLTTQIENITLSLRAVISSRNGLFSKVRNESKICELSHENVCLSNNDDDQQLTGCLDEEEFSIKVEPTYDDGDDSHETTSDPLYDPERSENDDDSDLANSDVDDESKYVCKICQPNVTFAKNSHLLRHFRNKDIHPGFAAAYTRSASRQIQCKLCNRKFSSNNALVVHLRNKHSHLVKIMQNVHGNISPVHNSAASKITQRFISPKQDPFPCLKCDKSFASFKGLHLHKRIAHEWVPFRRKCTLCPQVFANLSFLQRHMNKSHNIPLPSGLSQEARHSCAMCSKIFTTAASKDRHVEAAHFQDKTSCPYGCETKFDSDAEWVTHLEGCDSQKMTAESECLCQYCPAVFRNLLLQIEHRFRLHPEKCYSCSICEQKFTRQSVLKFHRCTKKSNTSERNLTNSEPDLDAESKYVCKICEPHVTFTMRINLLRHMKNKIIHPDISDGDLSASSKRTEQLVPPKKNAFPCPKCDKSFNFPKSLRRHQRIIHGWAPFQRKCTLCPQVFARLNLLQIHMHESHNVPLPGRQEARHSCDICLKTLSSSTNRDRHVEAVHFPDKTTCPYGCPTKFGSEAEWVTHLEGCDSPKMSSESKCTCRFCPAVFRNLLLRMEHCLRVHPETCCSCSFCERRFTRQSVLDYHPCGHKSERNVNGPTNLESDVDAKPKFVCKICQPNVTFATSNDHEAHMRNKNIHPDFAPVSAFNVDLSNDIGSPAGKISKTNDDQQITGCLMEEEEFPVKIEPTYDDDDDRHEIISNVLEQNMSESDDDDNIADSDVHSESKYVCKICEPSVTFSRDDAYERHIRNKNIHPDISDANFSQVSARLSARKFACKICKKKFTRNTDLRKHLKNKNVHRDVSEKNVASSKSQGEPESKYVCKICQPNVTFATANTRLKHMKNKNIHPDLADADAYISAESRIIERLVPPKPNPFPCPKCDQSFTSYLNLHRHKRLVHGWVPFRRKCTVCPQVFASLDLLQSHMQECHNTRTPNQDVRHSCAMCVKTFTTTVTRNRHVELVHFPDKTTCPYGCETKFDSEADWLTHLEGCDSPKMSAESKGTCKLCPAVFRSILLQIEHDLRVHPKNTFSCSICEQRFTRQTVLYDHRCTK